CGHRAYRWPGAAASVGAAPTADVVVLWIVSSVNGAPNASPSVAMWLESTTMVVALLGLTALFWRCQAMSTRPPSAAIRTSLSTAVGAGLVLIKCSIGFPAPAGPGPIGAWL